MAETRNPGSGVEPALDGGPPLEEARVMRAKRVPSQLTRLVKD